jgi:hypothetical protein
MKVGCLLLWQEGISGMPDNYMNSAHNHDLANFDEVFSKRYWM